MTRMNFEDLYVVGLNTNDISTPDVVFSTREEAQAYADKCNESIHIGGRRLGTKFYVESMAVRFEAISAAYRENDHRDGR